MLTWSQGEWGAERTTSSAASRENCCSMAVERVLEYPRPAGSIHNVASSSTPDSFEGVTDEENA